MVIIDFLGKEMHEIFCERRKEDNIKYSKIEGYEYLMFPDDGYYLHTRNRDGIISDCRIYLENYEGYFASKVLQRGEFSDILTLDDCIKKFDEFVKDVRVLNIPGVESTLPGKIFLYKKYKVTVYSKDEKNILYLNANLI